MCHMACDTFEAAPGTVDGETMGLTSHLVCIAQAVLLNSMIFSLLVKYLLIRSIDMSIFLKIVSAVQPKIFQLFYKIKKKNVNAY